jgi:hypothetical protein
MSFMRRRTGLPQNRKPSPSMIHTFDSLKGEASLEVKGFGGLDMIYLALDRSDKTKPTFLGEADMGIVHSNLDRLEKLVADPSRNYPYAPTISTKRLRRLLEEYSYLIVNHLENQ